MYLSKISHLESKTQTFTEAIESHTVNQSWLGESIAGVGNLGHVGCDNNKHLICRLFVFLGFKKKGFE